jgi:hypothetical protein
VAVPVNAVQVKTIYVLVERVGSNEGAVIVDGIVSIVPPDVLISEY